MEWNSRKDCSFDCNVCTYFDLLSLCAKEMQCIWVYSCADHCATVFVLCKNMYVDTKECVIAWGRNSITWHYCLFYFFFAPFSCFLSFFFIGVVIFFTDKENEASHCNDEFIQPAMAKFWHWLLGYYEDELTESLPDDNWDYIGQFCFVAVLLDLAKACQGLGVVKKATVWQVMFSQQLFIHFSFKLCNCMMVACVNTVMHKLSLWSLCVF